MILQCFTQNLQLKHRKKIPFNNQWVTINIEPNNQGLTTNDVERILVPVLNTLEKNDFVRDFYKSDYHLIFCFSNFPFNQLGALEHNLSSVYFVDDTIGLRNYLVETLAHEILHVVTPLHLKSEKILKFNYNKPDFSQHLWLYEGVTEYIALKCNLESQLIDSSSFFRKLRMANSNYTKQNPFSMTEMSKHILTSENQKLYPLVYTKGSLIGFNLDVLISEKSQGQQGILDLLEFIYQDMGSNQFFKEDELFASIKTRFPELTEFVDNSIISDKEIPFEAAL